MVVRYGGTRSLALPVGVVNRITVCVEIAGIREVIYDCDKYADTTGVRASKKMMDAAGVKYRAYERTGRKIEIEV